MKITALAGGVGASKLLVGLGHVTSQKNLTVITNTGDDIKLYGLYISPDTDIVTYTLAGIVNPQTGWGIRDDTFDCLKLLSQYSGERWFNLGDKDIATHLWRTHLLSQGRTLSEVTDLIRKTFEVSARIIPMTDSYVPTRIKSGKDILHFQEYLIKHHADPRVDRIFFENIDQCLPSPAVAEAILEAEYIIICPSNPLISIGPILAVPGTRALLKETKAKILAVSPIVAGRSLKGPSDRMLADLGYQVSAVGVARMYKNLLDVYVIDQQDERLKPEIEAMGIDVVVTGTVMHNFEDKVALAETILNICERRNTY